MFDFEAFELFQTTVKKMPVTKSVFDAASDITAYTLTNATGRLKVKIIDYGATIVSIIVPDREGVERDVVLVSRGTSLL